MLVLNVLLEFTIFVVLGVFIMRIGLVDAHFRTHLSKFVMNVSLPCLIANSLRSQKFDGSFGPLLTSFGLCAAVLGILFVIGQIVYLLMGKNDLAKTARFSTVFSNFTFVGFAVVQSLYRSEGLFTYTLFTLPVRIVFYAAPSFLLSPDGRRREKRSGKELCKLIFTAPTVAIFVGLFLYFTGLELPVFLDKAVVAMSDMASPLGMLICGMGLASTTVRGLWERKRIAVVVACKNFIAPAAVMALLLFLPIDTAMKLPMMVYAIAPVPSLLTTFSINVGRSEEACADASAAVLLSTVLCIATLPLWVWLSELVLA